MSEPRDDDRPRSARPAVPPFHGPRTESTPAERGQGAATSSAPPRPFIPGAPGSAAERPLTPPPAPPEPEPEPQPVFESPQPSPDLSFTADAQSAGDQPPVIAEPSRDDSGDAARWTSAASTVDGGARNHAESERASSDAEVAEDEASRVANPSENGAGQDQRLPALRFTGSSAFAAILGATDGADVDASVDDAFSALDGSPRPARVEPRAAEPIAEPVPLSRFDAVEAVVEPVVAAPQSNTELPWLDTGSEPEPPQPLAEAPAAVVEDSTERAARALEKLAARVRRGDLPLPESVAGARDEAMLAAVLAALLGAAG